MKIKNKKTISFLGFTSILAGLTASSLFATSCSNAAIANSQQDETPEDSSDTSPIEYTTVTFDDLNGAVTLIGPRKVKARIGKPFASITPPKATKSGLKFEGWALDKKGDEMVEPTKIIEGELTVYPIFIDRILLNNCLGVTAIETTTMTFVNHGTNEPNLQYSIDYGENWDTFPAAGVELKPGDNMFVIGENYTPATEDTPESWQFSTSANDYTSFHFSTGGSVNIGGNIMGLLDGGRDTGQVGDAVDIPCDYCFYHLFGVDTDVADTASAINYVSNTFLPAETLTAHCYEGLFYGCSTLIYAPWLPAGSPEEPENGGSLADGCYNYLFYNCSSLEWIKLGYEGALNETYFNNWVNGVTQNSDYEFIYNGSTTTRGVSSIPQGWEVSKAPIIPEEGEAVSIGCIDPEVPDDPENPYIFVANHPYTFAATVNTPGASQRVTWVSSNTTIADVNPDTGVVTGIKEGTCKIYAYSIYNMNVNGFKEITIRPVEKNDCLQITALTDTTIQWEYVGTGLPPSLEYSTDAKIWSVFWTSSPITLHSSMGSNNTIYIKGNNKSGLSDGSSISHAHFTINGSVQILGNAMGLLDDGRGEKIDIPCKYCFKELFKDNSAIKSVTSTFLPATTLKEGCYQGMFSGCTSLTSVPDLNVDNLSGCDYCYQNMFFGCSGLEEIPNKYDVITEGEHGSYLPAKTLAKGCYSGMFYNCTSLKNSAYLPATTPTEYCYNQMYQECQSLIYAYPIKLTSLKTMSCYQMFPHSNAGSINAFSTSSDSGKRLKIFTCPSTGYSTENVSFMFPNSSQPRSGVTPTSGQEWYCKYLSADKE